MKFTRHSFAPVLGGSQTFLSRPSVGQIERIVDGQPSTGTAPNAPPMICFKWFFAAKNDGSTVLNYDVVDCYIIENIEDIKSSQGEQELREEIIKSYDYFVSSFRAALKEANVNIILEIPEKEKYAIHLMFESSLRSLLKLV